MSEKEKAPALGISVQFPLDDKGKMLVFQTHLDREETTDHDLNTTLDKLVKAGNRQQAMMDLPVLEQKLIIHSGALENMTKSLDRIDEQHKADYERGNRRGEFKRSTTQENDRTNVLTSIDRGKQDIAGLQRQIAECKTLIAGTPAEAAAKGK